MKKIFLFIGLCIFAVNARASYHWKKVLPAFDTLTARLENGFIQGMEKSGCTRIVSRMYELADEHKTLPVLQARAMYWDARIQVNADSSLYLLKKSMDIIDSGLYEYDYFRIRHLQTKHLIEKGNWLPAYIQAKEEEKYFQETGDICMSAYIYANLGIIMNYLGNTTQSLDYLEKGDSLFGLTHQTTLQIKNRLNICNILYKTGQDEEAIKILRSLSTREETRRDTSFYINVLLSLGFYDLQGKDIEKYIYKAYDLAQVYGDSLLIAKTSINKATLLYRHRHMDSAEILYRQTSGYAVRTGNHEILLPALAGITNTFAAARRWDSAYFYSSCYQYYNDSILKINNMAEIDRIEGRAAIEKYENDLQQMKIKTQLQQKNTIWILVAILCISLFICSGFWYMHKKERMKKLLKEVEIKELNASLENEMLKNERYHMEINFKNRELTSNIMLMQGKNLVLRNLLRQIDTLDNDGELSRQKSSQLKKQINNHLQADDEWKYFKLHFESVYPGFFVALKKHNSSLTENDLRLCAYIRIGMSIKQIAQMLLVQPDSIKISRYRLRKKLALTQKDSLEDFLRKIRMT